MLSSLSLSGFAVGQVSLRGLCGGPVRYHEKELKYFRLGRLISTSHLHLVSGVNLFFIGHYFAVKL